MMDEKMQKVKKTGEVFTPLHIVNNILDLIGYKGKQILDKHIIDNSAGVGAFLNEIVSRYIYIAQSNNMKIQDIKENLEKYIHGIELNKDNFGNLIQNLDSIINEEGIKNVKWDVLNCDALTVTKFNNKMDYVVGNPPYVRVHNLSENYNLVKSFDFSQVGMTDLFIVFFEVGFKMLNVTGKMSYISPTSWWTSLAGAVLRKFILMKKNLSTIVNLGHYNAFKGITTFTCISIFENNEQFDKIKYLEYSDLNSSNLISYEDVFIDNKMYFSKINGTLKKILNVKNKNHAVAKNGYATLNDDIFIKENFPSEIQPLIKIIKASTGKTKICLYPYDKNGKLISFMELNKKTQEYLNVHLKSNKNDWYGFGRTQALNDTFKEKIIISCLIKSNPESLKILKAQAGIGVYSGIYILTNKTYEEVKKALVNPLFINFVESLKKYKNGGYYTFNTSDVQKYLNYYFEGGRCE